MHEQSILSQNIIPRPLIPRTPTTTSGSEAHGSIELQDNRDLTLNFPTATGTAAQNVAVVFTNLSLLSIIIMELQLKMELQI